MNKEIIIDGIPYRLIPVCRETEPKCIEVTFNDWRLPTIKELLTLINYEKHTPACNLEDTQLERYWSSSPDISDTGNAWVVFLGDGSCDWCDKSGSYLVRCVRDGSDGLEWSASSEKSMTWDEAMEYVKNLIAPVYYKG